MTIDFGKALKTNKISRDEAIDFFSRLKVETDEHVKKTYPYYWNKKLYPIQGRKVNGASKTPKFIVNHHTSGHLTSPAFYRFCNAKMASANFIVERDGNILYLVDLKDMAYHAVNREFTLAIQRLIGADRGFLDEPGIETIGNGNKWLFTYQQFVSLICLQRYMRAYYPSIVELKSHRFFSHISRAGDPGPLYMLPLVEHAVFNDVDLTAKDFWLLEYKVDPVFCVNQFSTWMEQLGIAKEKDEWGGKRNKIITTDNFLKT